MTLFDDASSLLHDALVVAAHARPVDGKSAIDPGDTFVATFSVENIGVSDRAPTQARTSFVDVSLRIEATPFAAPLVDGEPVNDVVISIGELIYGESSATELSLRALAALDGPEPFARVIVGGQLDLHRFFSVHGVHRFSTEIRRAPAHNPAVDTFRDALIDGPLPEGFSLQAWTFDFDDERQFNQVVDDLDRFRAFVRERVVELAEQRGLADQAIAAATLSLVTAYCDVFETGYQAALAFALWFIGFDQGESVAFDELRSQARHYFEAYATYEERRELRMLKGFDNDGVLADPVTVIDLPVVVDYDTRTLTLWAGSLRA